VASSEENSYIKWPRYTLSLTSLSDANINPNCCCPYDYITTSPIQKLQLPISILTVLDEEKEWSEKLVKLEIHHLEDLRCMEDWSYGE